MTEYEGWTNKATFEMALWIFNTEAHHDRAMRIVAGFPSALVMRPQGRDWIPSHIDRKIPRISRELRKFFGQNSDPTINWIELATEAQSKWDERYARKLRLMSNG